MLRKKATLLAVVGLAFLLAAPHVAWAVDTAEPSEGGAVSSEFDQQKVNTPPDSPSVDVENGATSDQNVADEPAEGVADSDVVAPSADSSTVETSAASPASRQEEATAGVADDSAIAEELQTLDAAPTAAPTLSIQPHVSNLGWRPAVGLGETAGTTGRNLPLEALRVQLKGAPAGSGILVRAHVSTIGWQEWETCETGTTGQALSIEAIQLKLTGTIADSYDIWYRVHSADFGWLGWAKNGESAGSQGYAKAAQAIEVRLYPKNEAGPSSDAPAFRIPLITYSAHVADIGWQGSVDDGAVSGTTGRNLQMEALRVSLGAGAGSGGVQMRAHVSNVGWQDWTTGGTIGTTGRALGIEAISLKLTGDVSKSYDIWYRVHSAEFGWLGWAKNGEDAGSSGWARSVQAVEICLLPKNAEAPGPVDDHFVPNLAETTFSQVGESTTVAIVPATAARLRAAGATEMRVTATMSYNGKTTRSVSGSCALAQIPSDGYRLNFGTYGPFSVTVSYRNGSRVVASVTKEVGVTASEYNLAPLSASFPVVLFSLSYWDINTSAAGSSIPTIVMLDRPSAYNWDSLPSGMYGMPYLTQSAIKTSSNYQAFADYVGALYRLNPNSKFNLYINDITCTLIHQIIYANKIPSGQYRITMLSDGSATYVFTNEAFAISNPQAKQDQLIASWNAAKSQAYATGRVSAGYGFHEHWDSMYAVLACEPGTEWWMTRTNLFTSGDGNAFAGKISSNPQVKAKNIASMLSDLQSKGSSTVNALKKLYSLSDGYFTEAEEQGKTPMILLGTYVTSEQYFEEYADITEILYGDKYAYYYKGHPNTPTDMYPQKQEQLDRLGITDVDSSVAAELILFFNPEVHLSGYGSSTFNSATSEMACGLFGATKDEALSPDSSIDYSGIDWFATPVTSSTAADIRALCPTGRTCFLIEFSDQAAAQDGYAVGIYSKEDAAVTLYSRTNGGYHKVGVKRAGTSVAAEAHVSDLGWQQVVKNGGVAGTTGQAKSLEALKLSLQNAPYSGSIRYRAHVSEIGWQGWAKDGVQAGTTGRALSIEAIRVELTGEMAQHYDVWYRVHVSNIGWMGWTSNGSMAGTSGRALPVEAIQVVLVERGAPAPGDTSHASEVA